MTKRKLNRRNVATYTKFPSGAIEVAAMVDGYRKSVTYYGMTKAEAVDAFLAEVNG